MLQTEPQIDFSCLSQAPGIDRGGREDSVQNRWEQIRLLVGLGHTLEKSAPDPAALRRVRDFNEVAWQRAVARLFKHAGV